VACIAAGARNSTNLGSIWQKKFELLQNKNVIVIFWLEEDRGVFGGMETTNEKRIKTMKAHFVNELYKKLKWLTTKVDVLNADESAYGISANTRKAKLNVIKGLKG
jgi:hypothetical protein